MTNAKPVIFCVHVKHLNRLLKSKSLNVHRFVFAACVQESFSASGGLDTLSLALVRQASAADTSLLSCKLSVTISKTLSACITGNCAYHS